MRPMLLSRFVGASIVAYTPAGKKIGLAGPTIYGACALEAEPPQSMPIADWVLYVADIRGVCTCARNGKYYN